MKRKIKALLAYPKYKKKVMAEQKLFDETVLACAKDNNAVICGERPKLIPFMVAVKIVLTGRRVDG